MSHQLASRRNLLLGGLFLGATAAAPSLFAGRAVAVAGVRGEADEQAADAAADKIVAGIELPRIPQNKKFPVGAYGAVADGKTDNTRAFAAAIVAANKAGGGQVTVPAGTYFTGPIHLLSGVELHLEQDSTLLFSSDPAAYLPVVHSRWQGIELMNYSPLIYAYGQHDIAITGKGVLDGQASFDNWWDWKKREDSDFSKLEKSADAGVPVEKRVYGEGHFLPPCFVEPYSCKRVLIEGVTIKNSPFWSVHPTLCQSVTVRGVTVASSGPNTDGCDPESCDGVLIDTVTFGVGDDCIAIKAGRNTDGRRLNTPCQNIVIQNCSFAEGHGAVTLGSEMTGGVRNVYARDLTMSSRELKAGHRLKTNSVRGGFLENINVYRVTADVIGGPMLLIDFNYGEGDTGKYPPTVTDINLMHWNVASAKQGWDIQGYSKDPIGTVRLSDITIDNASKKNIEEDINDLVLKNVTINGIRQSRQL